MSRLLDWFAAAVFFGVMLAVCLFGVVALAVVGAVLWYERAELLAGAPRGLAAFAVIGGGIALFLWAERRVQAMRRGRRP